MNDNPLCVGTVLQIYQRKCSRINSTLIEVCDTWLTLFNLCGQLCIQWFAYRL